MSDAPNAHASGHFQIGGDLDVHRLGFGAMRITGEGVWGEPADVEHAKQVLRRALDLGVTLIDTADSYGPEVSERLIGETLHPYPDGLVIATKAGLTRSAPGRWDRDGHPDRIRGCCEASLKRLKLDQIDLYQFHAPDPEVPLEESLGAFKELKDEGKVRHVGVCNFGVEELARGQKVIPEIVSVQNRYNLADREHEDVLDACAEQGIGFIPWYPLATGELTKHDGGPLAHAASAHDATPSQVALAWLLQRSPVMLPIPGTGSVEHLEENIAAAALELSRDEYAQLEAVAT